MVAIPKGAAVPQDHKKPAAQLEAEKAETVVVEYGGQTYTMPASLDESPGDVIDAIDDQKMGHALRSLMGTVEWGKFKTTAPLVRDYNGLFAAYAAAIGFESAPN
jgi:hypothetical protein